MRKENNKIVEEEEKKNEKERCKPSKTLCAVLTKDSLPSLTILIEYLIEAFFLQLF